MNNADLLAQNIYDAPPPFWRRHAGVLSALAVFFSTALLTVLAFPPSSVPELAYAFAAPAALWAYRSPSWRLYAGVVLGAQAVAWSVLLSWLHHVTWLGLFLLGPFIGVWVGSWFLAARWLMPRLVGHSALTRISAVFGLAALWVVIEWTRTWVLSGFPWLPLAASQWQRASILQIAAYTGAGGVSFVLIAMNLGFAAYAHRLFFEGAKGLRRRSQEFFAAMFLLIVCLSIHVQETFNRGQFAVPLARVAFVQPNIPQAVKWDPAQAPGILEVLERTTLTAASRRPDVILWPEAVTPLALKGDPGVRNWTESLVRRARAPLVLGSIAIEQPDQPDEAWYNAAFTVTPDSGVVPAYYAKRRLVPFGEFVPLRPLLGWLDKFVPIGGDFQRGIDPAPLLVPVGDNTQALGPLICYEDIFPRLARESAAAGADALLVLTNNGWFGEGGAAYQHAAHSVLRAIETRRPVLRCGNAGWSGWIDEFGAVRAVLQRVQREAETGAVRDVASVNPEDEGTIYFRGSGIAEVTRDHRWAGRQSFYVQHGDWFVLVSAVLAVFGYYAIMFARPTERPEEAAEAS
ncbi:MAG TPA: apolipoprotein N-acyltransferase [Opitutaceae bacterium]